MAEAEEKPVTEEVAPPTEGEVKEAKPKGKSKAKAKGKSSKGAGKGKPDGPTWGGQGYRLNVKNFGNETNEELKAMFEPFGTVVDAQVRMNEGKSRGFGYVIFSSEDDAKKAIAGMHDKEHGGKKLNVMPAERRTEEPPTKGKGKGTGKMNEQQSYAAMQQQQQAAVLYHQNLLLQSYITQLQQQQYAGGYDPQGLWHAPTYTAPQSYEGSIKKINDKGKYAFISCKDTHDVYGRDVYLDPDKLPEGTLQYSRVKFGVELNEKGHPRASWCELA